MTGGGGKAVARLVHQARDKTVTEIGAKPLLLRSKRTPKRPHCEHDSSSSSSTSTTLGALTVNAAHTKRQDRKAAVKSGWWHGAPRCAATHAATHCNPALKERLQSGREKWLEAWHPEVCCNTHCNILQYALQHTATHCNPTQKASLQGGSEKWQVAWRR